MWDTVGYLATVGHYQLPRYCETLSDTSLLWNTVRHPATVGRCGIPRYCGTLSDTLLLWGHCRTPRYCGTLSDTSLLMASDAKPKVQLNLPTRQHLVVISMNFRQSSQAMSSRSYQQLQTSSRRWTLGLHGCSKSAPLRSVHRCGL